MSAGIVALVDVIGTSTILIRVAAVILLRSALSASIRRICIVCVDAATPEGGSDHSNYWCQSHRHFHVSHKARKRFLVEVRHVKANGFGAGRIGVRDRERTANGIKRVQVRLANERSHQWPLIFIYRAANAGR